MSVQIRHFYPNGRIEVGTGKPGYRWVPAYSEVTATGYSMPLTRRNWYAMAKRDGYRCKFHADEKAARAALASGTH